MKQLELLKQKRKEWEKQYDRKRVAAYLQQNCKEEWERQLWRADLLMEHTFVFDDVWDMEPCATPYQLQPMRWDTAPNQDEEWIYMLNRHGYLYALVWAYWGSGEWRYLEQLKAYLFDWIAQNPMREEGGVTIRTIDTGIRCMNWTQIILHLAAEGALCEEELEALMKSMEEQIQYLLTHYIGKYTLSNWGVLQTTAIVQAMLWFGDLMGDPKWKEEALLEWNRQIKIQVLEDGSHWEQSIMYHMEVFLSSLSMLHTCWYFGEEIEAAACERMKKMADYVLYAAAPDRNSINQGDSDTSNLEGVMVKAAVIWNDGTYKVMGPKQMDGDSAWLFGAAGIRCYEGLASRVPDVCSRMFEDSGNLYVRSGWGVKENYTYLHCGSLGSGHGHADLGHLSLYYQGEPYLIDCGRYTYREDDPRRCHYKSAYAHNGCVLDQMPHAVPSSSWEYSYYAMPFKNYFRQNGGDSLCEMAYSGRLEDGSWYVSKRIVGMLEEGIWVIADEMQCAGEHSHKIYYHLHENVELLSASSGSVFTMQQKNHALCFCSSYQFAARTGMYSPVYNQEHSHTYLEGDSGRWIDRTMGHSIFYPSDLTVLDAVIYQYGSSEPARQEWITAKEFCQSGEVRYAVIFLNDEVYEGGKMWYYRGIPFHGKAVVFRKVEGQWIWKRLKA